MGKNQRDRKQKKEIMEQQVSDEIKARKSQKFNNIAIPTGRVILSLLITIAIIFLAKIILLNINIKKENTVVPQKQIAVIEMDKGKIKIELNSAAAPKTVENFKKLAEKGYYNNLTWHRVVQDFVIQGGDPKGDGTGGESANGGMFGDEINPTALGLSQETITQYQQEGYQYSSTLPSVKMTPGVVAMANSGPNTNGSQFFIVTNKDQNHLDGKHTVFGKVIEGMEVVLKVTQGDVMKRVYIENNAS